MGTRGVPIAVIAVLLAAAVSPAADGDLDASFGIGGKVATGTGVGATFVGDVAVQADGRIVVAGDVAGDVYVVRYTADGSTDGSFGTAGIAVIPYADPIAVSSVAVQPDGKIVVGGSRKLGVFSDFDPLILRLDADGTVDGGFASGGTFTADLLGTWDQVRELLVQPDGKLVALLGGSGMPVVRLDDGGALDSGFGSGGVATGGTGEAYDMALQADGGIVVGGPASLVRYTGAGALDPSYGSGGIVTVPGGVTDLVLLSDSSVVSVTDAGVLRLRRWDSTGAAVGSFGTGGIADVTTLRAPSIALWGNGDIAGRGIHEIYRIDVAADASDRVIIVGQYGFFDDRPQRVGVLRLDPVTGEPDPTFTACVAATTGMLGEAMQGALAVQPDGRLVVAAEMKPFDGGVEEEDPVSDHSRSVASVARFGTPAPLPTCAVAPSGASGLTLAVRDYLRGKFRWRWAAGSTVAKSDFGLPTAGTDQTICFLDRSASVPQPVNAYAAPGGSVCAGAPCWKEGATRFTYRARRSFAADPPVGTMALKLQAGAPPQARILFKSTLRFAARPGFDLGAPPTPLTVRLARGDGGACWEATFSSFDFSGPASGVVTKLTATSD